MGAPHTSYIKVLSLTLSAAAICACMGSAGLAAWADNLPDSALARQASTAAHALDGVMTALGAGHAGAAVQSWVRQAEARRFGN